MATALHRSRADTGQNHVSLYPRTLMADLDFKDNRYPSLPVHPKAPQRASAMLFGASDRSGWESSSNTNDGFGARRSLEPSQGTSNGNSSWALEQPTHVDNQYLQPKARGGTIPVEAQPWGSQSLQSQAQSHEPSRSTLSYVLPPGAARRVVERYSLDDNDQRIPSRTSTDNRPIAADLTQDQARDVVLQGLDTLQERPTSTLPVNSRRPLSPPAGGVDPVKPAKFPSIMPLSASPSYNPPVAPTHRAYAQQPTYITPPSTPTPINTVYSPKPPRQPQEEVCVECAMRDEDMADVDVTSPGAWERESDALFEDLKLREMEDDARGLVTIDDPKRPRVKGGRLTEQNLKLWLSMNPREPASRQQTLNTYIKSQRTLLEAEALARARAMQEAQQFDSRVRDTYSQLRRSAYDLRTSSPAGDDAGGVRIKPPMSPSSQVYNVHTRSHSREITLLENGMIVEHVDVRKEEKEARERRKKEERRARKSSRGSIMDVTSVISAQSLVPPPSDSGIGLRPYSRYSQTSSGRPTSVLTAPHERPDLPRTYSQASFSEVQSLGSASPRRTRFFGIKNLNGGWKSQDSLTPSGMSGSMVDMHVALQREAYRQQFKHTPGDVHAPRQSRLWHTTDTEHPPSTHDVQTNNSKPKKKKGFAKIWSIVTGSNRMEGGNTSHEASQSTERTEDDLPLAPPPPLSYLVERSSSELRATNSPHPSTPPHPSTVPSRPGRSSPGIPGTLTFPSPDIDTNITEVRNPSGGFDNHISTQDSIVGIKNVHPVTSEPDMRQHVSHSQNPLISQSIPSPSPNRPNSFFSREKSLPPLPGEPGSRAPVNGIIADPRPQTVYTYDPRQSPIGSRPAHDFLPPNPPFQNRDARRQSFGGLSSRPNLTVQTMPSNSKQANFSTPTPLGQRYDEFGASRRSLGLLDLMHPRTPKTPVSTVKRKSKFGFATLLGKKTASHDPDRRIYEHGIQQFSPMRRSGSDGQDDATNNGYATSTSRHSALSAGGRATRMSVTSRKALEERVSQDPEFVAYRYPSNDQRLDLLR